MKRAWHLALLGLVAAVVPAFAFRSIDPNAIPPWSDYWDYLQIGRQISSGQGFTSLFTYPIFLKAAGDGDAFPLVWRPPLFPALVALVNIFTGGPSLWAPLALQVAGYVAAVLGAYLLALKFVEPRWALFAGVVTAFSPAVLGVAEPGIATVPFTALLTFGFLLAVRSASRKRAFWTGAFFGALVLLRGETLLCGPAVVWMLWAGERGDRENRIWSFLGGGLLVLVPWTIRTWIVTGRPFSTTSTLLFTDTRTYPGWESSRRLDLLDRSALLWALSSPGELGMKALRNAYHYLRQALLMPIPALAPFVWAAVGRLTRVGRESAFCASLLISIVLFVVVLSPLEYAPRFLHPFIPSLTVVGVIVLSRFREDLGAEAGAMSLSRRPAVWAAMAVLVLAGLELLGGIAAGRRERAERVLEGEVPWSEVAASIGDGYSFGDYPACYAWQTGKRFVWIPSLHDLDRVARHEGQLRTVVLHRARGTRAHDPTGLLPTPALGDSLLRHGWTAREVGPLTVFEDPGRAAGTGNAAP